jgi:hypothetical protein
MKTRQDEAPEPDPPIAAAAKYGSFLFSPETARYYHRLFSAT